MVLVIPAGGGGWLVTSEGIYYEVSSALNAFVNVVHILQHRVSMIPEYMWCSIKAGNDNT